MAEQSLEAGLAILANRTKASSTMIHVVIAVAACMFIGEMAETVGLIDVETGEPMALVLIYSLVLIGFTLCFLASVVVISMWIYRAHANLQAAGFETEFTPGWAVGWYFIPIMNLFKPFQAMRELYNTSQGVATDFGGETPSDVGIWWSCYIAGNILSSISLRMTSYLGEGNVVAVLTGAIGTLLTIGSAWYLLLIIREVARAQRSTLALVGPQPQSDQGVRLVSNE